MTDMFCTITEEIIHTRIQNCGIQPPMSTAMADQSCFGLLTLPFLGHIFNKIKELEESKIIGKIFSHINVYYIELVYNVHAASEDRFIYEYDLFR